MLKFEFCNKKLHKSVAKNNLRGWLTKERKIMGLADFHCSGSEHKITKHKITKQKIWCDELIYIFSRTPSTEKSIAILQYCKVLQVRKGEIYQQKRKYL